MAASPEITKGLTVFDKRAEHGKLPCQAQVIHIVTGCYILQQLLARQAVAHAFATGLTAAVDKSGRGDVVRAGSIAPGDGGRSVRDTQSATAPHVQSLFRGSMIGTMDVPFRKPWAAPGWQESAGVTPASRTGTEGGSTRQVARRIDVAQDAGIVRIDADERARRCLLYTSPSPRDKF